MSEGERNPAEPRGRSYHQHQHQNSTDHHHITSSSSTSSPTSSSPTNQHQKKKKNNNNNNNNNNSSSSTTPNQNDNENDGHPISHQSSTDQNRTHSESKPKKKLKRKLASCTGCRKRRTRCDRGFPCSECNKRNLPCDYSGASAPPILTHRSLTQQIEREEYIKQLEARLQTLEQASSSTSNPTEPSSTYEPQDFTIDDLAGQLSTITIGQRTQSRHQQPHPLKTQVESILSSQSNVRFPTFIPFDQQFSLNLVASNPIPTIEELCSTYLPTRAQFDLLSEYYFSLLNVFATSVNPMDWRVQFDTFWNTSDRINFRPSPSPADEPDKTLHYLAQFLAIAYAIAAHGLTRLADIHNLSSAPAPDSASSASSPQTDQGLWNMTQSEKIALSNRWFRFSLGLLMSPVGNIYVKPTIFGIRAMSILSNVELAPENLDHGIFFWSLTTNLATSAGLLREPPVSDEEDIETISEEELESRRQLASIILALDWSGHSISGGIKPRSHPDEFSVKMPGTVTSPVIPLHPADGWPFDPFLCAKRASAFSDRLMQIATTKVMSGQPATYQDILSLENQFTQFEQSIPSRLHLMTGQDGMSSTAQNDPIYTLLSAFIWNRFSIARVRLHRLFILPKKDVPPEERLRQLQMLLMVSKRQFLAFQFFPHSLRMHPLMLYGLVNTAVACSLVILLNRRTPHLEIDEDFFLTELNKVVEMFDLGKKTIATTMASKSVILLQTLLRQIELGKYSAEDKSWDRRKKGPGASLASTSAHQPTDAEEGTKRKAKFTIPNPADSRSFPPRPSEFRNPSYDHSQTGQDTRRDSMYDPNQPSYSLDGAMSSPPRAPSYSSSANEIHHSRMSSLDTVPVQQTPPLVFSQSRTRPGYSARSSSSYLSPPHVDVNLDQLKNSHFRPIACLPPSLNDSLDGRIEFGSTNATLDHHQFDFSPIPADVIREGQVGKEIKTDGGNKNRSGLLDIFNPDFLHEFATMRREEGIEEEDPDLQPHQETMGQVNLQYFQPAFQLDSAMLAGQVDGNPSHQHPSSMDRQSCDYWTEANNISNIPHMGFDHYHPETSRNHAHTYPENSHRNNPDHVNTSFDRQ